MNRYQIKIVDADLTDMVHEMATNVASQLVTAAEGELWHHEIYPPIFEACRDILRRCVRGFHVCGCARHCDAESQLTELADREFPPEEIDPWTLEPTRISRYVLSLEISLHDFARELETAIMRAVARSAPIKNWHHRLFPIVRGVVEPILARHVYYSPTCNRGEYICEVGECTEFDPWKRVEPKEASR